MASDSRVSPSKDPQSKGSSVDREASKPEDLADKVARPKPVAAPKEKPSVRARAKKGNGKPSGQPASGGKIPKGAAPPNDADQPGGGDAPTAELPETDAEDSGRGGGFLSLVTMPGWFGTMPSWLVSMVVHVAVILVLAYVTLPEREPVKRIMALANPNEQPEVLEQLDEPEIEPVNVEAFENDAPVEMVAAEPTDELTMPEFTDMDAAPQHVDLSDLGLDTAPKTDLTERISAIGGTGLEGRGSAESRNAMVRKYGGSKGSEAAVANALKWFAIHQLADGGWNFDHTRGACRGRCNHPGTIPKARNGATAMALLPFLGAGQTHKEGKYKQTVERGLKYLITSMKVRRGMGDLTDPGGSMYSHGLSSIALCEAYAMTNDPGLLKPAQLALNFIVYAQDPVGGGWRYRPQTPGDTSVVGWQLMALKSGHMAYLKVPGRTILGASKFLDFVQEDYGSRYGYTVPGKGPATTAVGLLCRMYLGWKKDNPALQRGIDYLHEIGPTGNMYYNYYATQIMRHHGGEYWEDWNSKLRDKLVKSQDQKGHAKGSWYFSSGHGDRGGRVYCTSMATMILEVYYRHMPIYGKQAAEEEFPL